MWWPPPHHYTEIRENAPQKAGTYTYTTLHVNTPAPNQKLPCFVLYLKIINTFF